MSGAQRFLALSVLAAACAMPRPVHPYRLEGFPGAPIEPGLFPLRDGARWVFRDGERRLELGLRARDGALFLIGGKAGEARIRAADGFVEIVYDGKVIDRPFKLEGKAGDSWSVEKARYTVFGYDRIEVLGERRRALVVAVDRPPTRDLYWFVRDIGWVRIRTEKEGRAVRDARLESFEPGDTN